MTKSSSSAIKKELAALPIARIETMDESYILPLREYLFTNGCQVFVNTGPTENVTYLFVVGDSSFVKKTLAFRHSLGKKQLVICWDTEDLDSIDQFLGKFSKIVFVDPIPLSKSALHEMLIFLFTSKGKELNMQTHNAKTLKKQFLSERNLTQESVLQEIVLEESEPLISASSPNYEDTQKKRVSRAISDMFGKTYNTGTHDLSEEAKKDVVSKNTDKLHKPSRRKNRKATIGLVILLIFIAPFLLYIVSFILRGWSLYQAALCFQKGNAQCVERNVNNEMFWGGYTHIAAPYVHTILRFPFGEKAIQAYERIDRLSDMVAQVENDLLVVNSAILSIGSSLFPDQKDAQARSSVVAVDTIKKSVPSIRNKLDLASGYLQSFQKETIFPFSTPWVQTQITHVIAKIDKLRQVSEIGERVSHLFPYVGGFRDKENILVLLQNSSELRPTGGFIGSIAHITASEGKLEDIRIEDVYTLDGQLKGHVDPPVAIQELLGQEHWYLRDSNWNPNFVKTAQQVQFFYEKETGEKVSTVVGLTSSFIVKILKIIGPIDIPFYKDRITADNFYLKSLYYTQGNFFPGSTQKKDFLGALMEAIVSKLQSTPQSGIAIMEIIHDSIRSRDIQLYTSDVNGQQAIEQFGWGGRVPVGTACIAMENQPPCIFSYIYINEANVSVNKVNSFVNRSQMHAVQIDEDGKISQTITRKLQNTSQGESGTGPYTAYLRIFIPEKGRLTGLTLDGKPIPMKDTKIKKPELPYGELDLSIPGLTAIGVAFEVTPGRERIFSASITLDELLMNQGKEGILTLFEQKQPGVDQVPTTTTISYPPNWEAIPFPSKQERVVAKPGYLEYNTLLSEDTEVSIRFLK